MNPKIPLYEPYLTDSCKRYVAECVESNWISSKGEFVGRFEKSFSNYTGISNSCSVSNGTVAIDLALQTLGIGVGDSVIVPSLGYIAAASSVYRSGAHVIFADVDSDTLQISLDSIKQNLQPSTRAVIGIHNYGIPYDAHSIWEFCKNNNIFHIEDCAEALGSQIKGKHVGNFGDLSTFSFYGNKTITTGEGGMLCSNSKVLIERARHLKSHAVTPYKQYWHDDFGCNYRLTNIACAIGLSQLECISEISEMKLRLFEYYSQFSVHGFRILQPKNPDLTSSNWMITFITKSDATDIRHYFESKGIETRPLFYPVHLMPMFNSKYVKLIETENKIGCGLNLPSYPHLVNNKDHLRHIKQAILDCPYL